MDSLQYGLYQYIESLRKPPSLILCLACCQEAFLQGLQRRLLAEVINYSIVQKLFRVQAAEVACYKLNRSLPTIRGVQGFQSLQRAGS